MVLIKSVGAKKISDSRKEKTISVSIKTNINGGQTFSASSPNGKSRGKNEQNPYKKTLDGDIETLKKFSDYFSNDNIDCFEDLRRIEDIVDRHIGANTLFALESAVLKALAKEQKKQVWQIINPEARKFPRLAGNCVGGGKHSRGIQGKKPDFQEFLLIPETTSVREAFELNKKLRKEIGSILTKKDEKFQKKVSDEGGWLTSLSDREILGIINQLGVSIGVDIAASSFYGRKIYHYKNPALMRSKEEHTAYISSLIKNSGLFYVEDPFEEEDFDSFARLLKNFPNCLVVGDDLITTNPKRFEKALKNKSINAVIVKPNQIGSLLDVKIICEMAKKNKIKTVFSHRSGETKESILADIAFGFGADFFKCGIIGKEREVKIKRLIEIQRKLR